MASNSSIDAVLSQLQELKKRSSKLEINSSGKLNTFMSKMKKKLDDENFIYSEDDLLKGVKSVFLNRERLKKPKIDPTDKRVQCPNGVLQFIGPFSTINATGEPNQAERRLGNLIKWGDKEMGEIGDNMMAEVGQLLQQLGEIGLEANAEAIMAQIPGLKGKPLKVLLEILHDYLNKGKKKISDYDRRLAAEKGLDSSPDRPTAS
ncbi:MAG: hypothetical protein GY782_05270 [Gammaproteobacteria bacterium]|nr:hypothetical protein [Gammaproteobacteria bacterium]